MNVKSRSRQVIAWNPTSNDLLGMKILYIEELAILKSKSLKGTEPSARLSLPPATATEMTFPWKTQWYRGMRMLPLASPDQ